MAPYSNTFAAKMKKHQYQKPICPNKNALSNKKHSNSIMSPLSNCSVTICAAATKINAIIFWFSLVLLWSVPSNWNQYPMQRRCMLSSIKYYPLYSNRFVSFSMYMHTGSCGIQYVNEISNIERKEIIMSLSMKMIHVNFVDWNCASVKIGFRMTKLYQSKF